MEEEKEKKGGRKRGRQDGFSTTSRRSGLLSMFLPQHHGSPQLIKRRLLGEEGMQEETFDFSLYE